MFERRQLLRDELAGVVGDRHVVVDPEVLASYEVDWTGRWRGDALLVVRPGSTAEVAAVLAACSRHDAPVVPQGGNTGLVGGSVPRGGEVVVSLRRLDAVDAVDDEAGQVRVGAGVTLARLQEAAEEAGYAFGVDLAARDSATVGGMVATNAGGIHVLRYGSMRAQVRGVEAVLADGRVLERMSGLLKDNAGYDLAGLVSGSEGTLAIVTAAQLHLVPQLPSRIVAMAGLASLARVASIASVLRRRLPDLHALEAIDATGIDLVTEHSGLPPLFRPTRSWTLLVECAGAHEVLEELSAALGGLVDLEDTVVATAPTQQGLLWSYRERLTEAIAGAGVAHKFDVTLPCRNLGSFELELRDELAARVPDARPVLFGHVGDGNLHVNLLGLSPDDRDLDELVLTLVARCGGSISAEHGIGIAKSRWLSLVRSQADIDVMVSVKAALDPRRLLNPGVIFP